MKGFGLTGLIITVVVIAIVGGGYYYVQETSNDEAQTENLLDVINEAEEVADVVENNQRDIENNLSDSTSGITITSPQPNEEVIFPVTIKGFIDGNGWFGNEGEVGTVETFDANDKSVSNVEILKATTNWLELPTQFEATVGDREMISHLETDTGYLLFKSKGAKDGDTTSTFKVPVEFKKSAL